MEDRIRIIDEIVKGRDYRIALFSTFNFEIDYFERAILSRLFDNGIRKISLFVDSKEFEKSLHELDKTYINIGLGKKYIVSPVAINGAFHPKMVLLLGERKARLIVSSANVKTSGYEKNNEIYNVIDYSDKSPEYKDLIVEAIKYFVKINDLSYGLDSSLINECKDFVYYSKYISNNKRFFIGNYEDTIIDKLKEIIKDEIKDIKIAVPYYDSKTSAISKVLNVFSQAKIELYVQQKMSTFPIEYEDNYSINIFDKFNDNGSSSFYHGKVFLFKGMNQDYILYGSANCTISALDSTYKNGGNVECDLLDVGECGEFDIFFENLHLIKNEKLVSNPMTYDNQRSGAFSFLYAETTRDGVECHVKCSGKGEVEFLYKEKKLEYKESEDEYIVFINKENTEGMNIVFDMTARINGIEELVRCWIIDRFALSANRKDRMDRSGVENFDIDSDGEKYREDRINLLNAELMCIDEILEYQKMRAVVNQQKIMEEEAAYEDSEEEDFIVDTELQYEYKAAYRRYSYVERIRGLFIQRFLHPSSFRADESDSDSIKDSVTGNNKEDEIIKPRKATTEEKRFERFVKTRVKGMLNPEYVDMISIDHYLGIVLAVTNIFKKYNSHENVVDIFTTDYVIKTKVNFLKLLLSKDFSSLDNSKLYEEHLIVWTLCILLENHRLIKERFDLDEGLDFESYGKDLLKYLEEKYSIRENLQEYIKMAYDPNFNIDYKIVNDYGVKNAVSYIDSLYGYKDKDKLNDYIISRYGANTIIKIDNNNFCVDVVSNNIIDNLLPDTDIIQEVITNARNTNKSYKYLIINIKNINKSKAGHIDSIKHKITLDIYRKWTQVIVYSDGRKEIKTGKSIVF